MDDVARIRRAAERTRGGGGPWPTTTLRGAAEGRLVSVRFYAGRQGFNACAAVNATIALRQDEERVQRTK